MKLYKYKCIECLYCKKFKKCNVICKRFDCFKLNINLCLLPDTVREIYKLQNNNEIEVIKYDN